MKTAPDMIVFSDLDGTLLDHETYSWEAAEPALAAMRERDIPLVLASSKTAAEIADLREAMGFAHCPAIVENGAGVLPPGSGTARRDDSAHRRLIAALDDLPPRLREKFSGFSDWTVDEVATRTGLPPDAAAKAARRDFSEPGIWSGSDAERAEFEAALAERGIAARQGGRYLALSFGATKASRMAEIAALYGRDGEPPRMIALGDAPNDTEMLEAANIGIVVANPHAKPLPPLAGEAKGRIMRTQKAGPAGWNEALLPLLQSQ